MDSPHTVRSLGQSPFFYYNPEPGHFSQRPSADCEGYPMQHFPQHTYHAEMMALGHGPMMYGRQASSASPVYLPSKTAMALQSFNTPVASPRPLHQRPAFLHSNDGALLSLNTECSTPDLFVYPSTPPLSVSASTVSSPPSTCGILPTPVSGSRLLSDNLEGVKEGCQGEVQTEILAGGDWTHCGSPPLTPVFINPSSLAAARQQPDLLSLESSCPSLSPSPSPVPCSTVSDQSDFDFCDPRELFVNPANSTFATSTVNLQSLPSRDHNEQQFHLSSHPIKSESHFINSFDSLGATTLGSLAAFDTLSDFDSENGFITHLAQPCPVEAVACNQNKRQRLELLSFEDEDLLSEDSFDDVDNEDDIARVSLPTSSHSRRASEDGSSKMKTKKRTTPKKAMASKILVSADSKASDTTQSAEEGPSPQQTSGQQQNSSVQESNSGSSDMNPAASSTDTPAAASQPLSRRGRKQSLTEDPSKAFVCTLCSRRFRRQEHLKRHYRSLHTHDKPFKCNDCGKQFSRSDNLSQHARTHGTGAMVMGVLEEGEMPPSDKVPSTEESEAGALGSVLFEAASAAANASGSTSGSNSVRDSTSPAPSMDNAKAPKKRKREE
ncbi:MAG: hypothetical protein Q9169_006375 [Polycauliona sp. 2 TL-2023]